MMKKRLSKYFSIVLILCLIAGSLFTGHPVKADAATYTSLTVGQIVYAGDVIQSGNSILFCDPNGNYFVQAVNFPVTVPDNYPSYKVLSTKTNGKVVGIEPTYQITFDANGGINAPSQQIATRNQYLTLSSSTPTRTGYQFSGWEADGAEYQAGGSYKFTKDMVLTAKWTANIYTITLDHQEGQSSGAAIVYQKYEAGWYEDSAAQSEIKSVAVPVYGSYYFGGYYTKTDGQGERVINKYGTMEEGSSDAFTADGKLYAYWSEDPVVDDDMDVMVEDSNEVAADATHIFYDYTYTEEVDDIVRIYAGGAKVKEYDGTKKVTKDYGSVTFYTDICASYNYTGEIDKNLKAKRGKVQVVITDSKEKPPVVKGKVKYKNKEVAKIAKARISAGQITVKAGKMPGLVYLWVIDTGKEGTSECIPINVKTAAKKIFLTEKVEESRHIRKIELTRGSRTVIYLDPLGADSNKAVFCNYGCTISSKGKSSLAVTKNEDKLSFTLRAKEDGQTKQVTVPLTFYCKQSGKKAKLQVSIVSKQETVEEDANPVVPETPSYTVTSEDTDTKEPADGENTENAVEKKKAEPHIFLDYDYKNVVSDGAVTVYNNGKLMEEESGKVNYKTWTGFTDIKSSYIFKESKSGKVTSKHGKVIVGLTMKKEMPVVKKDQIIDKEAEKYGTASIRNGMITVRGNEMTGTVYLWVIDTGDNGTSACIAVNILAAPVQIKCYNDVPSTPGAIEVKNVKVAVGESTKVYLKPIDKRNVVTDGCQYEVKIEGAGESYLKIKETGEPFCYEIEGTALKKDRDTRVAVTFTCKQSGRKCKIVCTVTSDKEK